MVQELKKSGVEFVPCAQLRMVAYELQDVFTELKMEGLNAEGRRLAVAKLSKASLIWIARTRQFNCSGPKLHHTETNDRRRSEFFESEVVAEICVLIKMNEAGKSSVLTIAEHAPQMWLDDEKATDDLKLE